MMQRTITQRASQNFELCKASAKRKARVAMLTATSAMGLASTAYTQTTLYFDGNGTVSGLAGAGTWQSGLVDWNTSSTGAAATSTAWANGDIASFNYGTTVSLVDSESPAGLTFVTGGTTITTPVGTTGEQLSVTTSYNSTTGTGGLVIHNNIGARQVIAVPIVGSGDIVGFSKEGGSGNNSNTVDFVGNLTGFTGNFYLNNDPSITTGAQYQIDSPTSGTGTIYLDQNVYLTSNNQVGSPTSPYPGAAGDNSTGTLYQDTPNVYTVSDNMVLNYKSATTSNNTIGAANGPSYSTTVVNTDGTTTTTTYDFSKIMTFSGAISSPTGVTSGLIIGGARGTTILTNSNNSYNGPTQVEVGNNNGMFQIGADNAIPAASQLIIGSAGSVGPTDLDGHSITVAGLWTGDTGTTSAAVGNIYNLTVNNPSFAGGTGYFQNLSGNTSTITITPTAALSKVYYGDIGCTTVNNVNPLNDNQPYSSGLFINGVNNTTLYTTANTNINLVLNAPTGGGSNIFTLAPVGGTSGEVNGNEYSGTTTINSGAALVLGRGYDKKSEAAFTGNIGSTPLGGNYTLTGGGNVTVNSGGTLASLASSTGFYIGGASGAITLNSGSNFLPGQGAISGAQGNAANTVILSPNNVGIFSTSSINFNAGATMQFSILNGSSYDYVFLNNSLNLDSSSNNHLIDVNLAAGGTLAPGNYNFIEAAGGINQPSSAFTLNSVPAGTGDTFTLAVTTDPNTQFQVLQLQVVAPVFQWDPTGQGATNAASSTTPVVAEGPGVWTDTSPASTFYRPDTQTEATWSNSVGSQVLIGDDATQAGGVITLGDNIVVAGGVEFGPILPGSNYSIANASGNSYSLTVGAGGVIVANTAATSTTWSAEIDVPVILSGSQTWSVPTGQSLYVTGPVTGAGNTLTFGGGGLLELAGANGNIGSVNIAGGTLLLGSPTAIGIAPVALNGGALQWAASGSYSNAISIGTSGGSIGATTGITVTYSGTINSANTLNIIGTGTTTLTAPVTVGSLNVQEPTGGVVNFNGMVTVSGTSSFTGGSAYFNNSNSANVFTGGITIQGGLVYAQSSNALGNAVITFPGSPTGGLDIAGATTLSNPLNGTGSGATTGGNSYGDTIYFDNTKPFTLTGSTEGTGDLRWYADPNFNSGSNPTINFDEASTRPGGGAEYYNIPNLTIVIPNDTTTMNPAVSGQVAVATAMGLSTQSFMAAGTTTIDVETPYTVTGDLRGEATSTGGTGIFAVTKTGPGILALSGSAGSSTPGTLTINNGEVQVPSTTALGGQAQSTTIPVIGVVVNNTGVLGLDYNGRQGGITLNNGGTLERDNTYYSENTTTFVVSPTAMTYEVDMTAASASDIVNVTGTGGKIEDAAVNGTSTNTPSTNELFTLQNPVMVNTGATLKLQNDNPQYSASSTTGGAEASYILALRGPGGTGTLYDTLTIQSGATVANTGPGEVRFGRTNSGGLPIIAGSGVAGDAVLQLGSVASGNDDVYMTDSVAANPANGSFNTIFVINGASSYGLRVEAPMNATYEDPNSASANPLASEGTTGLLGINTTATAPNGGTVPTGYFSGVGNAFTVASPNRLQALSVPYSYVNASGTTMITPAGTLTLAANDAGDVTGQINDGPLSAPGAVVNSVTQGSVALALDNTSGSSGKHIYQINPAVDANGGSFANFAGLTVERTYSSGASVIAQLVGNTKIPSLTITGGAKVDITNQALVVDPTNGPAPTSQIAAYLASAYDNGLWDGPGIGSSSTSFAAGTTIGYAENDLLPNPYNNTTNIFGGASGQLISDSNAVLVRYTYFGDLNLDGTVDGSDLAMMGARGTTNVGWIGGDLNYDGKVNADDWALFQLGLASSSHGQITSAVPEPAAASLVVVGAGMMMRRRRRA
ncbi:MAG TPA: dockerin type I repeat-containing protein [Tepidisphaeraceae bacterium]|jgi:hypothetical protein